MVASASLHYETFQASCRSALLLSNSIGRTLFKWCPFSLQELVLDENGAQAVAHLALDCRSLWKRNRPVAPTCIWYECKLLGLAVCRACNSYPHNRIR